VQVFGEAGKHCARCGRRERPAAQCDCRGADDGSDPAGNTEGWTTHALSAEPTHSLWDRTLPPRLHVQPGDEIEYECIDASGGRCIPAMTAEEFLAIDRTRIHALTGPVWIDGAEPGDVLQVDVLATQHHGWGWSSVIEGLGFLKERFRAPYSFTGSWTERDAFAVSCVLPIRHFWA